MTDFGQRLRGLRGALGLTQPACARVLDVPMRTYADWERGVSEPALVTQEGAFARLMALEHARELEGVAKAAREGAVKQ